MTLRLSFGITNAIQISSGLERLANGMVLLPKLLLRVYEKQ